MTALKPLENLLVKGVPSSVYPLNDACAKPDCFVKREGRKGAHHIFPRSLITNDSYFVQIHLIQDVEQGRTHKHITIPHVTWLCPEHHDDVEMHRAWIKLEDEEEFVWYDREEVWGHPGDFRWERLGPLDPQPGGRQKVATKPRPRKKGDEARVVKSLSFRLPSDAQEDGFGMVKEQLARLEEIMGYDPKRTLGWTLMDAVNFAVLYAEDQL